MLRRWVMAAILAGILAGMGSAQNAPKFLTNDDVVSMVKAGQDEATILDAIHNQGTDFDVSAKAALQLKKSGVSMKVIDAMVAAVKDQKEAAAALVSTAQAKAATEEAEEKAEAAKGEAAKTARASAAASLAAAKPGEPSVVVVQGTQKQLLAIAHTQIVPTQAQESSLEGLASDGSLSSTLTNVAQLLAKSSMMKPGSGPGIASMAMTANPIIGPAFIASSLFLKHKAASTSVTAVWAIPGQKSETVVHDGPLAFEVQFDGFAGINVGEYEPILVRLRPTPTNFRLVGAITAKPSDMQSSTADWSMYASFVEQRVPIQATKAASGRYLLQPKEGLGAGEYGVVLRPVNRDKKFAGSNVGQNVGDGLVFNCVWSFAVQ